MIWKVAIYGSDEYFEPDENSEVSLTTMGFTDPMTEAEWLKFRLQQWGLLTL